MGYKNEPQRGLLLNIPSAENLFANISSTETKGATKESIVGTSEDQFYYLQSEIQAIRDQNTVFNMPFLLHPSQIPWDEANSFLCSLVQNKHVMHRPTEDVRRRAAVLLDFRLFCDAENLDWLDFSGKRLSSRPTYRYFNYLSNTRGLKPRVINLYTSYVYQFYEHVALQWPEHQIDMARVDRVDTIKIFFNHAHGAGSKDSVKRSQTKNIPSKSSDPLGYVRDDGELLRPLSLDQWKEVLSIINQDDWGPAERLTVLFSAMTGARKQTVLTLRVKHINLLRKSKPSIDGTYKLFCGPGTLIDTKNSKHHTLHLPSRLVDELIIYANSEGAMHRRGKFKQLYEARFPSVPTINEEDIYLFLSDQGNCYYMGKDDPRYPIVKSKPVGQVVENLKRKIIRSASKEFPPEFYFHWLRATYAYLLWIALQKYIDSGELSFGTVIGIIQNRLHHNQRETTENYLKLFQNIDIQLAAQKLFEDFLFGGFIPDEVLLKGRMVD